MEKTQIFFQKKNNFFFNLVLQQMNNHNSLRIVMFMLHILYTVMYFDYYILSQVHVRQSIQEWTK